MNIKRQNNDNLKLNNIKLNNFKLFIYFIYIVVLYLFGSESSTVIYSEIFLMIFMGLEMVEIIRRKKIKSCVPIIFIFLFSYFCLLSSLWAKDSDTAFLKAKTQFLLFAFTLLSYNFFVNIKDGEKKLLKMIMYAGLILSVYIILYYGLGEYITRLISGERVGSEIDNVNVIGLQTSISVIIAIFFALYQNNKKYYLITLIPLIVSLGTGSRKVLILLVLGTILLFLLKKDNKYKLKSTFKKVIYFLIIVLIFVYIAHLPMFSTIFSRFENTMNLFTGSGRIDRSTNTRKIFIELGLEQFKKTPFFGIGINNTKVIAFEELGRYVYLHNNYIELLASVGIIGFSLYYAVYVYIIIYCFKFLKLKNPYVNIIFLIFLVNLVLEFAIVSYYSKTTYIYIVLGLVVIHNVKNQLLNDKNKVLVKEF